MYSSAGLTPMMSPTSAAFLVPIFPMSGIICSACHFGGGLSPLAFSSTKISAP